MLYDKVNHTGHLLVLTSYVPASEPFPCTFIVIFVMYLPDSPSPLWRSSPNFGELAFSDRVN